MLASVVVAHTCSGECGRHYMEELASFDWANCLVMCKLYLGSTKSETTNVLAMEHSFDVLFFLLARGNTFMASTPWSRYGLRASSARL